MPDTTLDPVRRSLLQCCALRARVPWASHHPSSVGSLLFIGCRFDMEMHDWNAVDYIEVFNTSVSNLAWVRTPWQRRSSVRRALALWERCWKGQRIAAVTGKDLHSMPWDAEVFTTYAIVDEAARLNGRMRYWRSAAPADHRHKGPLFTAHSEKGTRNSNIRQHLRLSGTGHRRRPPRC